MKSMKYKFDKFVYNDNRKKGTKNFIVSITTIVLSMFVALFICMAISAKSSLFCEILKQIFTDPFSSKSQTGYLFSNMAIFAVAACSFIFAFKSGLFNIGISGQMLFGGMMAVIAGQYMGNVHNGWGQIIIILIAVISGGLIAGLVGFLKAKFNTNEVVVSIMLNWTIYFVGTYLVKLTCKVDPSATYTEPLPDNLLLQCNHEAYLPLIILAGLVVLGTFIVFKYLVFGKKLTNVGMSFDGSKYAGHAVKTNLFLSMLISGMIAGLLGAMVYCGKSPNIPAQVTAKAIPQEGFNGISVGLIAMTNPLGVVPVSFFFGMVETAKASIAQECAIDSHITDLMFGIIVYGAAIVSLFYYVKPWKWTMKFAYRKNKISYDEHEFNVENQINEYADAIFLINKKYRDYLLHKYKQTFKKHKQKPKKIKYRSSRILIKLRINNQTVTSNAKRKKLLNKIYVHYDKYRLSKGEK